MDNQPTPEQIGIETRKLMIDKSINQAHLVKRFKVSQSAISRALAGELPALLNRINRYLQQYKQPKAA